MIHGVLVGLFVGVRILPDLVAEQG